MKTFIKLNPQAQSYLPFLAKFPAYILKILYISLLPVILLWQFTTRMFQQGLFQKE